MTRAEACRALAWYVSRHRTRCRRSYRDAEQRLCDRLGRALRRTVTVAELRRARRPDFRRLPRADLRRLLAREAGIPESAWSARPVVREHAPA